MIIFKFSFRQNHKTTNNIQYPPLPLLQGTKKTPFYFRGRGMEDGAFRPVDAVYRLTFATLT